MPRELPVGQNLSNEIRPGTVSVVLCTYNGARYLPAQLSSYACQSRLPDELVIGDDGSTDETESLIAEFAKSVPFPVRFHRNPERLGVGRNFDQAIQRCTGEFIALSDQDDEWHPEKLDRLVTLLQAHPRAGYACSDAELIDEHGQTLNHRLWEQYRCPPGSFLHGDPDASGRHLLFKSDRILGASMVIRSINRPSLTPIPSTWVHDHWLSQVCEMIGAPGVSTPELLTRYRLHGQQTCGLKKQVGQYRKKTLDASGRQAQTERRQQRLIDLRQHLVDHLIPGQPQLSKWLPYLDDADRIAEAAVRQQKLPWWHRKLLRLGNWFGVDPRQRAAG
jgi:glycosyltransferase involved in cell wall biosynthesis